MAYKSLKDALDGITESRRTVKGKVYSQFGTYLGCNSVTAEPKRLWAATRQELEEKVRAFYKTVKKGGEIQAILTPREITDAKNALMLITSLGLKLSLTDCVRKAMEVMSVKKCDLTVGECFKQYMETKVTSSLDKKATLIRVGKWVGTCADTKLVDLTADTILKDLKGISDGIKQTTYNGRFSYIVTFLNWCMKKPRCWIAENPLDGIEVRKTAWQEPDCISLDSMRILLKTVYERCDTNPEYVAYVALSFFCGVRREEILRIAGKHEDNEDPTAQAARINLDTRTIAILKPKGYLKGIKPRAFTIPDTAMAWIKLIDFKSAVSRIGERTVEKLYAIARRNGANIPKNCGRHSFITYHVCAYEDMAKTLMVAGTGEGMAESHYRSLKSHDEGVAYFALTPQAL